MKKQICFYILFFAAFHLNDAFSQSNRYYGSFENHFFGWYPSARMEAMGRGFVAVEGDPHSYYVNPGAMGTLEGLSVTAGFANPYYLASDAGYNYFSASYNFKKIGVIGISRDYSDIGEITATNKYGQIFGDYVPYSENYRLTFSREIINDFYAGMNLNYFRYNYDDGIPPQFDYETGSTVMADLGALKRFSIKTKGDITALADLGISLFNFTQSKISIGDEKETLPMILRAGGSYNMGLYLPKTPWNTQFLNILYLIEYQNVLNAEFYEGVKTGVEFTFFELVSLRGGFYYLTLRNIPSCPNCKDNMKEFTYGAGINLPLQKLGFMEIPASFRFDLAVMPQPPQITNPEDFNFGDYRVFNFTANVPF